MKNSAGIILLLLIIVGVFAFGQGSLTPPGAPAPTMKSLQDVWDKVNTLSQAQKFNAFTDANASSVGGLGSASITIPAGQTVKLESISVTTYGDPSATAYLRFLVRTGASSSRIMVTRIPLVTTGTDPVPDTRSAVLQLPMWVGGGGVNDVANGEVHSLSCRVQSSASDTASSSWVLTGTYVNP
jgi:hypothetical protein